MRVSLKGIIVGGVCDIVATNILSFPLVIYVIATFDLGGKKLATGTVASLVHTHPPLFAIQILSGLVCSVLGGYVAARLAKHDELLNAGLSSFLCVGIGVYSMMAGRGSIPWPLQLLLLLASALSYLLGGYLRAVTKAKRG